MAARRVTHLLLFAFLLFGCGRTGIDGAGGDSVDPSPTSDPGPTSTATPASTPFVPAAVAAEVVFDAPFRGWDSPLLRPSLPKITADAAYWYAAHAYLNTGADSQYVKLLRKRRDAAAGTPWEEAATIARPDDRPAGIVMDASQRLHLLFQCRRDGGGPIDISIGGSGDRCFASYEAGNGGRVWHVVFSTRTGDVLDFGASSGELDEGFTAPRGELGLGVSGSRTWWTALDGNSQREVRAWDAPGSWVDVPFPDLPDPSRITVEPFVVPSPMGGGDALLVAGEWDTSQQRLVAASGFKSMQNALAEVVRRNVAGALPLHVAFESNGTVVLLNDQTDDEEILRFDGGVDKAPVVLPIDVTDHARLQINSRGHWYLLDVADGANVELLVSADRGATWTSHRIPIAGLPANGDVEYEGFTTLDPHSAPGAFDPDRMVFLFTGRNGNGSMRTTYFGVLPLK